ncbi:MAG: prepilin-type N-terminal cleavage/methylation domain-containing protein [Desulfovibrionales bacterium]|nr:prepilin-type N-terminal cleavage/methylation domain-containing protein [Desulfovibrionales bacterium]
MRRPEKMKNYPRSSHTPCSGFTLVEVLVASAILAVGLLGVASMIGRSTIQDARAYHTSHASVMVEESIERMLEGQWHSATFRNMTAPVENRTISGVEYEMVCILANNTPIDNCKEMNCTVTWNNKGIQSQMEFTYVLSQKWSYTR